MSVEQYIQKIIDELRFIDPQFHLNERYLHHRFSRIIQESYPISYDSKSLLHPEWATYVKSMSNRHGGRYYKNGNKYKPADEKGSSGFIDFVIGNADNPDYGIEFKMSNKRNWEGLTYDYMKLMDKRNSIKKAISLAVYYGNNSQPCEKSQLEGCLKNAKTRLARFYAARPHWFILIEISDGSIINRFDSVDGSCFNNNNAK